MIVSYDVVDNFPGWVLAEDYFKSVILGYSCQRVLETGSGANPTLSPHFVRSNGLTYVTSDVDAEELKKADHAFDQLVLDLTVEQPDPSLNESFDCVLSRMVGEHVENGHQYHGNIFKLLRPGGISVHCFSTLWAIPFAVNRLLPEKLTAALLKTFSPRGNEHRHGKFKAYYSWSRGPSRSAIRRFENLGYEIVSYTGYFGHGYYAKRMPWLDRLEKHKSGWLASHPIPQLCSYATIVLHKPRGLPHQSK